MADQQLPSMRKIRDLPPAPQVAGFPSGPAPAGFSSIPPSAGGFRAPPPFVGTQLAQQRAQVIAPKRPRVDNGDGLTRGGLGGGGGNPGFSFPAGGGHGVNQGMAQLGVQIVAVAPAQTSKIEMKIANDKARVVIGRSGDNLNYMRSKSGADIEISPPADTITERTVYIKGKPQCVEAAKLLVTEALKEGYRPHRLGLGYPGNPPKKDPSHGYVPPALVAQQPGHGYRPPGSYPGSQQQPQTCGVPRTGLNQTLDQQSNPKTPGTECGDQQSVTIGANRYNVGQSGGQQVYGQYTGNNHQSHGTRQPASSTATTGATIYTDDQRPKLNPNGGSTSSQQSGQQVYGQYTGKYHQTQGPKQLALGTAATGATDGQRPVLYSNGGSSYSQQSGGQHASGYGSYYGYGNQGQHYTGNYLQNPVTEALTQYPTGYGLGGYEQHGCYPAGSGQGYVAPPYHGAPPADHGQQRPSGAGEGGGNG